MRISKTSNPGGTSSNPVNVKEVPYDTFGGQSQLTIGVVASAIGGAAVVNNRLTVRNSSTAGQIIRLGSAAVSFGAPPIGMPLFPGDTAMIDQWETQPGGQYFAIANAAGALLDVVNMQTSV